MVKALTLVIAITLILATAVGGYWFYTNKVAVAPVKTYAPQKQVASEPTPTAIITYAPTPTKQENASSIQEALAQKYNKGVSDVDVTISKIDGIHATGSVQFAGEQGGGIFFAYKDGENWKIVHDGNGIIPCEKVDPYLFPTTMVPECVDKNGDLIKK